MNREKIEESIYRNFGELGRRIEDKGLTNPGHISFAIDVKYFGSAIKKIGKELEELGKLYEPYTKANNRDAEGA